MSKETEAFKRGMIAGAKPLEEKFSEFKEEYIKINKETQCNQKKTNQMMSDFIDSLNDFERKSLLGLSRKNLLSSFNENESIILINGLYTLMIWEGPSTTDEQKLYFEKLSQSLGVDNHYELDDISIIETYFETIDKHKEYLSIVLEFGFLNKHNFDFLQNANYSVVLKQLIYSRNELEKLMEIVKVRYQTLGSDLFCNRFLDRYSTQLQNVNKEEIQKSEHDEMKEIVDNFLADVCDKDSLVKDSEKIKILSFECGQPALNKILACIHIDVNRIKKINNLDINKKENATILLTTLGIHYKNKNQYYFIKYKNIKDREYQRVNDNEILKIKYMDSFTNKLQDISISHDHLFENKLNSLISELYDYSIKHINKKLDDRIYGIVEYDKDIKIEFIKLLCNYLKECHLDLVYILFGLDNLNFLDDEALNEVKKYYLSNGESNEIIVKRIKVLIAEHDDNSYDSVFSSYLNMCIFIAYLEDNILKNDKFDYISRFGKYIGFNNSVMDIIFNYSSLALKMAYGEINTRDYIKILKQIDKSLKQTYLPVDVILGFKEQNFLHSMIMKLLELEPRMDINSINDSYLSLAMICLAPLSLTMKLSIDELFLLLSTTGRKGIREITIKYYIELIKSYENRMSLEFGNYTEPFKEKGYFKLLRIKNDLKNKLVDDKNLKNKSKDFVDKKTKKIAANASEKLHIFKKRKQEK